MLFDPTPIARVCSPVAAPEHFDRRQSASVAAILLPAGELLFMRRAEVLGDRWSGHISFPGGRAEETDESPLHTAIRETYEEIGLDLSKHHLLGSLNPVTPVSGVLPLTVHPFVFFVDLQPSLHPNREVASLHRQSIHNLQSGVGRGAMAYPWQGQSIQLPCVDFDGVRLWGLTLKIVDDLLHRLDGKGQGLARPPRLPS